MKYILHWSMNTFIDQWPSFNQYIDWMKSFNQFNEIELNEWKNPQTIKKMSAGQACPGHRNFAKMGPKWPKNGHFARPAAILCQNQCMWASRFCPPAPIRISPIGTASQHKIYTKRILNRHTFNQSIQFIELIEWLHSINVLIEWRSLINECIHWSMKYILHFQWSIYLLIIKSIECTSFNQWIDWMKYIQSMNSLNEVHSINEFIE